MNIDFGVDECAAPWSSSLPPSGSSSSTTAPEYQASSSTSLPRVKGRREMQQQQRQGSAGRSLSNRFDLLSLDSGTDSDEGQESDDPDS